jgi:excisionase family DNA binding protein
MGVDMEIKENEVYTHEETQALLKVSASTVTRMIKKGFIRTARVGKQYRIMGKEHCGSYDRAGVGTGQG